MSPRRQPSLWRVPMSYRRVLSSQLYHATVVLEISLISYSFPTSLPIIFLFFFFISNVYIDESLSLYIYILEASRHAKSTRPDDNNVRQDFTTCIRKARFGSTHAPTLEWHRLPSRCEQSVTKRRCKRHGAAIGNIFCSGEQITRRATPRYEKLGGWWVNLAHKRALR